MGYSEDDLLALSGVQHFVFCRRQWALIHIEQQWGDNALTVQGGLMHDRAHDERLRERRGDLLIVRGLSVHSWELGLAGKCDVVEFRLAQAGVPINGEEGLWEPMPVEYKHGKAKRHDADRAQLCAQAMCLEEMLACDIPQAALYYGATHSREVVSLDDELRQLVASSVQEMHRLYTRGVTPKASPRACCRSCSLKDACAPGIAKRETVGAYLARRLKED